uniref:Uncharacterized protein n=1 Tax=Meloidogyne incognita TaxID=6306 RepID=A0A914M7V8_MELIC
MSLHRLFQKPLARVRISTTSSAGVEISFSGGPSRSSLSTTFFFSAILCRIASAETSLFTSLPLTSSNMSPGKMYCAATLLGSMFETMIYPNWKVFSPSDLQDDEIVARPFPDLCDLEVDHSEVVVPAETDEQRFGLSARMLGCCREVFCRVYGLKN